MTELFDQLVGDLPFNDSAFEGADKLWATFQENMESFINDPGKDGQANAQIPKTDRVDWEDIKDVLQGEKPISILNCN